MKATIGFGAIFLVGLACFGASVAQATLARNPNGYSAATRQTNMRYGSEWGGQAVKTSRPKNSKKRQY